MIENYNHRILHGRLSTIYCICFEHERSFYEVSNMIYGRNIRHPREVIKKNAEEGYFKSLVIDNKTKWISTVDPLIELIKKNIDLSHNDVMQLTIFLDSKAFRSLVKYTEGITNVQQILQLLSTFSIITVLFPKFYRGQYDTINPNQFNKQRDKISLSILQTVIKIKGKEFYKKQKQYDAQFTDLSKEILKLNPILIKKLMTLRPDYYILLMFMTQAYAVGKILH